MTHTMTALNLILYNQRSNPSPTLIDHWIKPGQLRGLGKSTLTLIHTVSCIMDYLLLTNFVLSQGLWRRDFIWQGLEVHIRSSLETPYNFSQRLDKPCIID